MPKDFGEVSEVLLSHQKYRTETDSEFSRAQELVAELRIQAHSCDIKLKHIILNMGIKIMSYC